MELTELILTALAALIALTLHEYAHGYAAYKLGDNTAKNMGRLTLNPIRHIDPFGALCMVLFHFGWAKPVPINPRNFKNQKRGFALTALAGPLTNILLAFISAFFYLLCYKYFNFGGEGFLYTLGLNLLIFLSLFHLVNLGLGLFNLIPIPPLDGSRILNAILPPKVYFRLMRNERKIYWAMVAWLLLGNYFYYALLSVPFIAASPALSGIAKIFSLSALLSEGVGFLSDLMIKFWSLLLF